MEVVTKVVFEVVTKVERHNHILCDSSTGGHHMYL